MKKINKYFLVVSLILTISLVTTFCDSDDDTSPSVETGTASLVLNAEDFHKGYVTQDNWTLAFDNVYIVVGEATFYQASPTSTRVNFHGDHNVAGHPSDGQHAHASGMYLLDLVKEKVQTIQTQINDVPVGDYIYTDYSLSKASTASSVTAINNADTTAAAMDSHSLKVIGTATKDGQTPVKFTLAFDFEVAYQCTIESDVCQSTVSVAKATPGQFEITIHLDHLFGAEGEKVGDSIDFQRVAAIAKDGAVELSPQNTHSTDDATLYTGLVSAARTVGHAGGECHCHIEDI